MSRREVHHHHIDGIGIGTVIAVILSYMKWHSIGWAIVAGLFGWGYVIYYLLTYGFPNP